MVHYTNTTKGSEMRITRHTDPATLDDCGRQVLRMVTPDKAHCDAWLEVIEADELEGLSPRARQICDDHGIDDDAICDYGIGDYLEGAMYDHRSLRDSDGEIIAIHILTAFGGPNCWEILYPDGSREIRVSWWGTTGYGEDIHDLHAMVFEYMSEVIACH